ncbi:HNH endonuclease-domain-containing protein [Tuber brumale]|nr:HNH endonuclease-domain-containing protein [Tuber brumale]
MSLNRTYLRNVHFCDATNPDVILGGFIQNGSITESNFLGILGIVLVVEGNPIRVQERISHHIVSRTDVHLQTGVYHIYCSFVEVSDEPWFYRMISHCTTTRRDTFRKEIRQRDGKCVISGMVNPEARMQVGNWSSFEAGHIFPLRHESLWIRYGYDQWITDMNDATGSSKINSIQNGLLLQQSVHRLFDQYLITINPDDGYKVVVFDIDLFGYDGRILDPVCRNPDDPHHVSDHVLRWHFRQSVLANVRGVGEPISEHEFPPGTDMLSEILDGPYARERFDLEMATRLQEVA